MKRVSLFITAVFFLLVVCLGSSASAQSWYDSAWSRRQEITIDSDNTAYGLGTNLTNFPYLIQLTDGGNELFSYAQSDGDDILFTADDGTTRLAHEIERYDSGGTTLIAWVNLPVFQYGADTTIYMYYGNPNTPSQEQPELVWDDDFAGVWHLGEDGSTSNYEDSTRNDNTGVGGSVNTSEAPTRTSGSVVGYAQDFDGTDDYVDAGNDPSLTIYNSDFTFEAWAKLDAKGADRDVITKAGDGATVFPIELRYDVGEDYWEFNANDGAWKYAK